MEIKFFQGNIVRNSGCPYAILSFEETGSECRTELFCPFDVNNQLYVVGPTPWYYLMDFPHNTIEQIIHDELFRAGGIIYNEIFIKHFEEKPEN